MAKQSGTFKMMEQEIAEGRGDQIATVFGQPKGQRGQAVPAPKQEPKPPVNRSTATTVNALPKPPMPGKQY